MGAAATIGFLSDYGLRDEFVGVCHGVIARRCPQARIIDIAHQVPRADVRGGALTLAAALPYLPVGVALAVVDPGVGGPRRALALRTREEERLLVGPDNGLLMAAAARFGGVAEGFEIGASRVRLQPVSSTFHGRDVFAPVAAALAAGEQLSSLGEPLAVDGLRALALPVAQARDGALVTHVLRADGFGNVSLDASPAQLLGLGIEQGESVRVHAGAAEHEARYARTFADVEAGALVLFEDAVGALALAVNGGSAAELLRVGNGHGELLLSGA